MKSKEEFKHMTSKDPRSGAASEAESLRAIISSKALQAQAEGDDPILV